MGYMDDWIVLMTSRSQLRKVVRTMHRTLGRLKLRAHPDKTYIGKLSKGVDFLGYRLTNTMNQTLALASATLTRHHAKVCELRAIRVTRDRERLCIQMAAMGQLGSGEHNGFKSSEYDDQTRSADLNPLLTLC